MGNKKNNKPEVWRIQARDLKEAKIVSSDSSSDEDTLAHDSVGKAIVSSGSSQTSSAHQLFDEMPTTNAPTQQNDNASLFKKRSSKMGFKLTTFQYYQDEEEEEDGEEEEEEDGDGEEEEEEEEEVVVLEDEDIDNLGKVWGYCLVGYFNNNLPSKHAVIKLCESWGVSYEHHLHSSGWFIFKFKNEIDRDFVLTGGPYWANSNHQLILKIMPYCFDFSVQEFKRMAVWATLPDLPLELWNAKALSKICSKIGSPLYSDKFTVTKETRVSYARVLVEVDASTDLVRYLTIQLPNGKIINQQVCYEPEVDYCSTCNHIGHYDSECNAKHMPLGIGLNRQLY